MTTNMIPMISQKSSFYGYIVGLQIERGDIDTSPECPCRMFARFEYGLKTEVYEVPDHELFRILSVFLSNEAQTRNIAECWHNKLWIEKVNGKWEVDLP